MKRKTYKTIRDVFRKRFDSLSLTDDDVIETEAMIEALRDIGSDDLADDIESDLDEEIDCFEIKNDFLQKMAYENE